MTNATVLQTHDDVTIYLSLNVNVTSVLQLICNVYSRVAIASNIETLYECA